MNGQDMLTSVMGNVPYRTKAQMDSGSTGRMKLDPMSQHENYMNTKATMDGATALQVWVSEIDPDAPDEANDLLLTMIRGMVDANQDGVLDEDEQAAYLLTADAAWAYASSMGASDEDLELIFNSDEVTQDVTDATMRVAELLMGELPDGEEADDSLMGFVFDEDAGSPSMDAAYKASFKIRNGRKTKVRERIGGFVKRTGKQIAALAKAQRKANTGSAKILRMKSFKKGLNMGLYD